MNRYEYTGNKTKNYFTAYLQKCIRWKRKNYLQKKANINSMEKPLEDYLQIESGMTIDEIAELRHKEELLLKECNGEYPNWIELSDQKLVTSILLLSEEEKKIIYQHVFEEKSFKGIGELNGGMAKEKVEEIYYYAIRKIRQWMGGGK